MVAWCNKHERAPPETTDWARRRLCAQTSSAASECAFSKAGLIVSKKRQRLMADHVDNISLMGWHYKDNGWGESTKRPRCVPEVEGERLEEEIQMAVWQGFKKRGGVVKIIIVHMHYDSRSSTDSERASALLQASLKLTMYGMAEHI